MQVGAVFNSEEEFLVHLRKWEDETKSIFYKRTSTSIQSARKKGVFRYINSGLPYQVQFCCIHGGKKYKKQSSDDRVRRNTRTFQKKCPANIRLIASKDGNHLTIASTNFHHNHETTEALHKHLPQKRKFNPDEKYNVEQFLTAGGNKKKIKHMTEFETNKVILHKDLRNLEYKRKSKDNSLNAVVEMLQNTYNAKCDILVENDVFKGIIFQTEQMISSMDAYPEFVAIDATYKLLSIQAPVYIILVENSNGGSEIVAVAILVSEDKLSMEWFIDNFKKSNPSWINNRVVMSDKDLLERQVLKENFPNSIVIISNFHSLKTFNREISSEKMDITIGQRDTAKEMFQKMLYSQNDEEYNDIYDKINELPSSVVEYFNSNWHPIRSDWTLNNTFLQNRLNNTSNKRLESINQKLKSVINKDSSLIDFVENFFLLYDAMLEEGDQTAAYEYFKVPLKRFEPNSVQSMYSGVLTNYAYNYVNEEIELYKKIKIISEETETCTFQSGSKIIKASINSCTCPIYIFLIIPCRHIFAVRERKQLPLFEPSLCTNRWTLSYARQHRTLFLNSKQPIYMDDNEPTIITDIDTCQNVKERNLDKFEKYKKSMLILGDIASLMSEQSENVFHLSMKSILKLKDLLLDGKLVEVCELDKNMDDSGLSTSTNKNNLIGAGNEIVGSKNVEMFEPGDNNGSNDILVIELTDYNGVCNVYSEKSLLPLNADNTTWNRNHVENISFHKNVVIENQTINKSVEQHSLRGNSSKTDQGNEKAFKIKKSQKDDNEKIQEIVISEHSYSNGDTSVLRNILDRIIIPKAAKCRQPKSARPISSHIFKETFS